jgi:spore coat polysaccharide biosynthesis protein SpsF
MIRIFIQARMSSSRFPGKVLAPFGNYPLINHVWFSAQALGKVVFLTSTKASDDPFYVYLTTLGAKVFRGDLNNVFKRFQDASREYPSDWIIRLCGDSPLLQPRVIQQVIDNLDPQFELISNVRAYPKGQRVEAIRTDALLAVDADQLWPEFQEHVTTRWYAPNAQWPVCHLPRIYDFALDNYCVDTIEDLKRLESVE